MGSRQVAAAENRLYHGDNLPVLRDLFADESVDLVYLDPPFNSNASYRLPAANDARRDSRREAFGDVWRWDRHTESAYSDIIDRSDRLASAMQGFRQVVGSNDTMAYLVMMAPRLAELHRVLKPTGSLYLHCDPTASHYLKLLLDAVFGAENFRNEIVWHYGGRGAKAIARQFARNHDSILCFSKENGKQIFQRPSIKRRYTHPQARQSGFREDVDGRWFKTAPRGDYTDESVQRLAAEGRIHQTLTGGIRIKYFLPVEDGYIVEDALVGDTWTDIPDGMHLGPERSGYPTQKPEALLERIIQTSSREGDLVLDPFCGSGTTLVVAQRLGRSWIGIDSSQTAIDLTHHRLRQAAVVQ